MVNSAGEQWLALAKAGMAAEQRYAVQVSDTTMMTKEPMPAKRISVIAGIKKIAPMKELQLINTKHKLLM